MGINSRPGGGAGPAAGEGPRRAEAPPPRILEAEIWQQGLAMENEMRVALPGRGGGECQRHR